jgi:hypothetical protein
VPESKARLLPVAVLTLALGGCGSMDINSFSVADLNPLKGSDPLRSSDYNYFYRRDASVITTGPVTAADLVGPDGRCAFDSAPSVPPGASPAEAAAAAPADQPINPRSNQALYFTAGPQSGSSSAAPGALPPEVRAAGPRGIALSMTECQVVSVAGYTNQVQVSANGRGERVTVLTYVSGDRPGIYHFRNGRLVNMERVAEPVQQPKRNTKTAKSKQTR